jgi:hypothetical protein
MFHVWNRLPLPAIFGFRGVQSEASAVGQMLTKASSTLSMNSISLSMPNMISGETYELPVRPLRQPMYYPERKRKQKPGT